MTEKSLKTILVLRLSSMGDVAMTVPILKCFLNNYKDYQIVLVTKPLFTAFFQNTERLISVPIDTKKEYKGLNGIRKFCNELSKEYKFELIIDLHNVIRSRLISFFIKKVKSFNIDKGRKEKKKMIRLKEKDRTPLKHMSDRYYQVFVQAGFTFLINGHLYVNTDRPKENVCQEIFDSTKVVIGIAPFALHKGKQWPEKNMKELLKQFDDLDRCKIILFGGYDEEEKLEEFAKPFANIFNIAGKYSLNDELNVIKNVKLMITMDSSNMHMSWLMATRVLSIWGGTHPDIGFAPLGDNLDLMTQISVEELPCRPCSVFGNVTCHRGDYACLEMIKPNDVYRKACMAAGILLA
ncbi:MAG: glycosyl transferase [Planctomycetota bacterium]|nr:MAG: glycosyl transferase [Planctomycetota bacterium]